MAIVSEADTGDSLADKVRTAMALPKSASLELYLSSDGTPIEAGATLAAQGVGDGAQLQLSQGAHDDLVELQGGQLHRREHRAQHLAGSLDDGLVNRQARLDALLASTENLPDVIAPPDIFSRIEQLKMVWNLSISGNIPFMTGELSIYYCKWTIYGPGIVQYSAGKWSVVPANCQFVSGICPFMTRNLSMYDREIVNYSTGSPLFHRETVRHS